MVNKRVTDILPPSSFRESLQRKPIIPVQEEVEEIPIKTERAGAIPPKITKIRISSPAPKFGLILTLAALILVGGFCFFTLSKANIDVWPKTENLTVKTKLTIDKTAQTADLTGKVIPGEIFEKEKTIKENFPSSGKTLKETKAEGNIRIYNAYSTSPQIFVVNTRFISTDGKTFRTPVKVTIAGGHYEKEKFIPSETDIKVVADEAGSEYNIGPSTFSIPGLAGTEKYTKFYAKSFQAMTGGFSEEVSKVTKEDLENAENSLIKKVKEECEAFLKTELSAEKISSEFNYLEKAVQTEIVEKISLSKAGDEAGNFDFQVKAKSKTLIFKKEDLKNFAEEFLLSQISKDQELPGTPKIYEKSLKIDFTPETINLNADKIILSLDASATIYSDIDISDLKNNLKKKSLLETKVFLESQPEIAKAIVEFWPFWVKSVPENPDKIKFNLNID